MSGHLQGVRNSNWPWSWGWGAGTAREKGCLLCSSCMLSAEGLLFFVLVILKYMCILLKYIMDVLKIVRVMCTV